MKNLSSLSKSRYAGIVALFATGASAVSIFSGIGGEGAALGLLATAAASGALILWQLKTADASVQEATQFCKTLAAGDFSKRISRMNDGGNMYNLLWSINNMADYMDAYIRESTAVLGYVARNQYFRRILENGLSGDLLMGARTINTATDKVAKKMTDCKVVANDVDASLTHIVGDISDTSGRLSSAAEQMQGTVVSTRAGTSEAITSTDETSQNVQAIASAAEQMSISIAEIGQQMSRTSSIASQAVQETTIAKESMKALVDTVKRIGEVVAMIDSIANQTNLLALNATIEAARAGAAGKGFTIVAAEVKELAAQTTAATEDIAKQINEIEKATSKTEQSFSTIDRIVRDIHEASTVVAAAVEEQTAASKEIASNVERAAIGTQFMAGKVQTIGNDIQQVEGAASGVQGAVRHLSTETVSSLDELLKKMGSFMGELSRVG